MMQCNALAAKSRAAADMTIPSLPGVVSVACVRFMFGKTSLASGFVLFPVLLTYGAIIIIILWAGVQPTQDPYAEAFIAGPLR